MNNFWIGPGSIYAYSMGGDRTQSVPVSGLSVGGDYLWYQGAVVA